MVCGVEGKAATTTRNKQAETQSIVVKHGTVGRPRVHVSERATSNEYPCQKRSSTPAVRRGGLSSAGKVGSAQRLSPTRAGAETAS